MPHFLVLNTSVVDDSDGATLIIRTLAPRPGSAKVLNWLRKTKLSSATLAEKQPHVLHTGDAHIRRLLTGPFAKLRLVTIEARVSPGEIEAASAFSKTCFARAYVSPVTGQATQPYRKMRVLVNPHGGPGKARQEWDGKVRPILEAAGCELNTTITTHRNHGLKIVLSEKDLGQNYDALLSVSGDGMMHEILNGVAARADAEDVLRKVAVVPIPTGSGNASSVSILGPAQGFNLSQAALNAIKGHLLDLDICIVTQPVQAARQSPHLQSMLELVRSAQGANGASRLQEDENKGFVRYYSFLSQAIGLMADLDIGTEHLRMLGDTRFVYGYLHGLIVNDRTPVTVDVKLGPTSTVNRQEMRERVEAHQTESVPGHHSRPEVREEDVDAGSRGASDQTRTPRKSLLSLRCGTVLDPIGDEALPDLDLTDPSWPKSRAYLGGKLQAASEGAADGWARLRRPVSSLYAGKLPYVGRDLLQFPYAIAGDHLLDVALMLHDGGRAGKLRVLDGAETGTVVYDKAIAYCKVEALRVTPTLPAGHAKLKKGGIISIDGERVPYAPFQVEVAADTHLRTLSLYGNFFMEHHYPSPV